MRTVLTLLCGTAGACAITAGGIVTTIFTLMGTAPELARSALTMAAWSTEFGFLFVLAAFVGHATGVADPSEPKGEESTDA